MIRIHYQAGRHIPLLLCDICGARIADAEQGAAVFATPRDDDDAVDVLHVHKHACHDAAQASLGGDAACSWQALGPHLLYLAHNAGLPLERLKALADRVGEF